MLVEGDSMLVPGGSMLMLGESGIRRISQSPVPGAGSDPLTSLVGIRNTIENGVTENGRWT